MTTAKRPILFTTDFDGTISTQDTGNVLIDIAMGLGRRDELDRAIMAGERTFRDVVAEMWAAVKMTKEEAAAALSSNLYVRLDPHFADVMDWCQAHGAPIVVLSGGLDFLVHDMLAQYLGDRVRELHIVTNHGHIDPVTHQWSVEYHDDTDLGHDKAASIRALLTLHDSSTTRPLVVFAGDGISDLSCAGECDVLFTKRGEILEKHCVEHGIPHTAFESFAEILAALQALHEAEA
ncbi:2,3-diketo-5-methylthio-1-phosphopentane phosphatase [Allomyces macrogynus ATCC 38327]|uniref:2,3-diketo-5-methylthio-1-phosphopentane phosphatase n=1 Tax=Allomyces macrogynus (strain ATCC 38327) TaxID=578462 RepID=A0A0L0SYD5_ALLM3|nr:2,3-diketo-5-methylthio-1-phosphopentane phosphatase [Allomyces macrogynus ATCC 38327]|eukprot:KNE67512.1 2,3-diketo-5-methylthio-1-phosphopentane phosphatase [Allomyces macrogynus ATCC 38327]